MNKKLILIFILFFLLLGNVVAPFILNDYHGNIIPVDHVDLEILNEEIIFNIIENKIEVDIKYEIVNNDDEKIVGFIFPVYSNYIDNLKIYFKEEKIDFEIVDELFLKEVLMDKWNNLKRIISKDNLILIDPINKTFYSPDYLYINGEKFSPNLYKFILKFERKSKNILNVKFKAFVNQDRKIYPKIVYSYFYILNTKDYFNKFNNINIKIYYPKGYIFSSNLIGEVKNFNDKTIYEINLKEISENLTFSYIKNKISGFNLFFYKHFPILFSPYNIFLIIFLIFIIIFIFVIVFIIKKLIKRKNRNV